MTCWHFHQSCQHGQWFKYKYRHKIGNLLLRTNWRKNNIFHPQIFVHQWVLSDVHWENTNQTGRRGNHLHLHHHHPHCCRCPALRRYSPGSQGPPSPPSSWTASRRSSGRSSTCPSQRGQSFQLSWSSRRHRWALIQLRTRENYFMTLISRWKSGSRTGERKRNVCRSRNLRGFVSQRLRCCRGLLGSLHPSSQDLWQTFHLSQCLLLLWPILAITCNTSTRRLFT